MIGTLLFKLTHCSLPVFMGCKAYTADLWFLFPIGGSAGRIPCGRPCRSSLRGRATIRCSKQRILRLLPPSGSAQRYAMTSNCLRAASQERDPTPVWSLALDGQHRTIPYVAIM